MKPEILLAHADFVRSLARHLVLDEHQADDVIQDTWLTALERPPHAIGALRSWLTTVMRNLSYKAHRDENRRIQREKAAATREAVEATELVLERETVRRRVVEAVLDLDEPYRAAIVLRFYDNQPPREIAKRLEVPIETAKTHLKRGLTQLRQKLDAQHGGDRKKWLMAVAPIAGLKLGVAKASVETGAAVAGVVAMGTKLKLTITAACVLAATMLVLYLLPLFSQSDNPNVPIAEVVEPDIQENGNTEVIRDPAESVSSQSERMARTKTPLDPQGTFISGKVVNKITGEPIKAFDFRLFPYLWEGGEHIHETVHDEKGRFFFPLEEAGDYQLAIRSSCHIEKIIVRLEIPAASGLEGVKVALDPGLIISGRVVEGETSRPMASVLVVPVYCDYHDPGVEGFRDGFEECCVHAITDASGRFVLRGIKEYILKIVALHPGYAQVWEEIDPVDCGEVVLSLQRGHCIYGKVLSDHGKPLPGINITMLGERFPLARRYKSGQEGSFRTEPSLPGRTYLQAKPPWGKAGESFEFTEETKVASLMNSDLKINFGSMQEYVTWHGTVYDDEGIPASEGWMQIKVDRTYPWPYDSNGMNLIDRGFGLDHEGCFEARKLPPGRYHISLGIGEKSSRREIEWGFVTFDQPGIIEKDIYISGAVFSGIVVEGYTNEPLREGYVIAYSEKPGGSKYSCKINEDGSFQLTGLSPGVYNLAGDSSKHVRGYLEGIKIEKGQIVRGLRIVTPVQGQVLIKIIGFNDPELREYKYYFLRADEPSYSYGGTTTGVKKDGTDEIKEFLEVGNWTITLAYPTSKGRGYIERAFEIHADSITELTISREDLSFFEGTFAVAGTLTLLDGSPVSDAEIIFDVTSFGTLDISSSRQRFGRAITNEVGRFELEGFKPGRWFVSIVIPEAGTIILPNIVLPIDAMNPHPLDLVLPQAKVCGTFCHEITSDPIDDKDFSWKIALHSDEFRWQPKIRVANGHANDPFQLLHVPPGRYVLKADVLGYGTYQSEPFSISDGQYLDLGAINLKPCGVAILEIVDEQNKPVEYFDFYVNGNHLYDNEASLDKLPDGRRRYNDLPIGDVEITILTDGYKEQKIIIHLEPGKSISSRVVMQGE